MQQHISLVWLSLCCSLLWLNVFGCASPGSNSPFSAPLPFMAPSSPEKTKIIVLRLENSVKRGKPDKSTAEDRLFGNGIKAQIVNALEQSGRFTVLTNSGPREVLQRMTFTDSGKINEEVRTRLGLPEDAELVVAGALTTYQLSKKSKNAGVEADLFFREPQARMVNVDGIGDIAKKVFEGLKPVNQDRIALELWLFDAKTGRRLAATKIEGNPSDSIEVLATAMQQAVRGSTTKTVEWITNTEAAFRAGTLASPPVTLETKKAPLFEQETGKGSRTSVSKQPRSTARPRSTTKVQSKTEGMENLSSTTSAAEAEVEDFSENSTNKPVPKAEKPPPQEEWGEK